MSETFRAPAAGRQALSNLRQRLRDPAAAASTADALESLDCELFLREFEQAYTSFRENNPAGWALLQAENKEFDGTLMDGLRHESP